MMEYLQRAGRGGRDGETECVVLAFAEKWAFEAYPEGLDRNAKGLPDKLLRTSKDVFDYVGGSGCHRVRLAKLSEDTTQNGKSVLKYYVMLTYNCIATVCTAVACCDSDVHADPFDVNQWLPRPFPNLSDDMDVDTDNVKKTRPVYRPTEEREALANEIITWRSTAHSTDDTAWLWPLGDILSNKSIDLLVRARSGTLATAADIQELLSETDEWTLLWADAILKTVRNYDYGLAFSKQMESSGNKSKKPKPKDTSSDTTQAQTQTQAPIDIIVFNATEENNPPAPPTAKKSGTKRKAPSANQDTVAFLDPNIQTFEGRFSLSDKSTTKPPRKKAKKAEAEVLAEASNVH